MKIIVVGCGKIGTTIIKNLVAEGHDVTAVDINPVVIDTITNAYDVMAVIGNGVDCDTLEEAGAADARLVIAVTPKDEVNILCCLLARRMGTHHSVARIEDPSYSDHELEFIKRHTNVSMFLKPAQLVARELVNMLKLPAGMKAEYFARRTFEMISIRIRPESALKGLSLIEMKKKYKGRYLVLAVNRGEETVIPDGNFVLQAGDQVVLGATPEGIDNLIKELGYLANESRSVIILGGSHTAYHLASILLELGVKVKIIEQNRERCRELCEVLPKATIINGDGTRGDFLNEEGIGSTDAFVSLTGVDEENLLMAIYARRNNVKKTLCKIDRGEMAALAGEFGMEEFVTPNRLVSNVVLRYVRALDNSKGSKMETLYRLLDGTAEAIEFIVHPGFKYDKVPLHELRRKMKSSVLIGGIVRGSRTIIPDGFDYITEGDRVIVLAANEQIYDLSDIFGEGPVR